MGQKYCVVNAEGYSIGFYDSVEHTPEQIPVEAFPISDGDWQEYIDNQPFRKFINEVLVESTPTPPSQEVLNKWAIDELEAVDKATLRLFMSLAEALMQRSVISSADFSPEELALYQQVKQLKGDIW